MFLCGIRLTPRTTRTDTLFPYTTLVLSRVPGVEVAGEQDHFVRSLAAGDLADHVLRGVLAGETAVERDAHAGRAQRDQARELVGIDRRQRGGRDWFQPVFKAGVAGVRRAAFVGAGRAHQEGLRALADRGGRPAPAHAAGVAVVAEVGRAHVGTPVANARLV